MNNLPSGTVKSLSTDIQGSTRLLQQWGDDYTTLLAEHHQLLREACKTYNRRVINTQGDSFFVVCPRAVNAIHAVV
jgi:class 3 adenylate cyclase